MMKKFSICTKKKLVLLVVASFSLLYIQKAHQVWERIEEDLKVKGSMGTIAKAKGSSTWMQVRGGDLVADDDTDITEDSESQDEDSTNSNEEDNGENNHQSEDADTTEDGTDSEESDEIDPDDVNEKDVEEEQDTGTVSDSEESDESDQDNVNEEDVEEGKFDSGDTNTNAVSDNADETKVESNEILVWNEDTWQSIVDNYVPNQKVRLGQNETVNFRGADYPKRGEFIGEIREGGQLVVNLDHDADHYFFWNLGQTPLCSLLRDMAVIDTIPASEYGVMPKRPLLNMTLPCRTMAHESKTGQGNWITAFYTTRIAAAAARVDVQLQCSDGRSSEMDLLLPWFEAFQPAPTEENPWPFQGRLPTEKEACSYWYKFTRVDFMIDEIRNDMQKMGVTMFGSQKNKSHPSVPLDQAPLVPDIEVEDVVIHLRCGDILGGAARADFGLMKFSEYKKRIAKDTRTVGIVTQPFEIERNRRNDQRKVDDCRVVTYHLVEYLQGFLPSATISIHNGLEETIPMTYARLVMADQSFTTLSSFGFFPVVGGFGKGYFQKGNNGVNPYAQYLPEIYPDNLVMMDAPILTSLAMLDMDLQSILDWFVEEEDNS